MKVKMDLIDEVYIILNFCMKHNTHKTHYNVAVELLVCHAQAVVTTKLMDPE